MTPAGGGPAAAGAGSTADHKAVFFSQKILAVRSGNGIYRLVRDSSGLFILSRRRRDLTRVQLNMLLCLLARPLQIPRSGGMQLSWGDSRFVLDWFLMFS
jgi:hypothetical protein